MNRFLILFVVVAVCLGACSNAQASLLTAQTIEVKVSVTASTHAPSEDGMWRGYFPKLELSNLEMHQLTVLALYEQRHREAQPPTPKQLVSWIPPIDAVARRLFRPPRA